MGIPHVSEQIRRAPALALRAVFGGIGRVLLAADRPLARARQAATRAAGDGVWPRQSPAGRLRPGLAPLAPPGSRWRSLDQTGNVRLLSDENADDDYREMPEPASPGAASGSAAAGVQDSSDLSPCSGPSRQTLPLANYDGLSLASIRARLRGLSVSELRVLAEYESKNAERPEVLGMFERRIEKLKAAE